MDQALNLLGIAKKAGLIAIGGDAVSTAARNGKAALIISASDSSEGSVRRARVNAQTGGAAHIIAPYTQSEIGNITGRGLAGTVAVTDAGLSAQFMKKLAETDGRYTEAENSFLGKGFRNKPI